MADLSPYYGLFTRRLQKARLEAARPFLAGEPSVLDVGCGLTDLPARFPRYVGCDRDPVVLAECRARYPRAVFVRWDVGVEPPPAELTDARFDVALMLAVLEHLADPGAALSRAAALLAKGGRVVSTTPHPRGHAVHEIAARTGLASRAAGEEHEALLDRTALAEAGRRAGLALVAYRRFLLGLNQLAVFARTEDGA